MLYHGPRNIGHQPPVSQQGRSPVMQSQSQNNNSQGLQHISLTSPPGHLNHLNNPPGQHLSLRLGSSPKVSSSQPHSPHIGASLAPSSNSSPRTDLRLDLNTYQGSPHLAAAFSQGSPQVTKAFSPAQGSSYLQDSLQGSPQHRRVLNSQQGSPQLRTATSPDSPHLNANNAQSNKIKAVFIGDGAVGKTSLIISYTTNGYPNEYVPTAIDTYKAVVHVDGEALTFELCDTPGQDDFDTLRPLVYPNVDVFVLCFSVVTPSSFSNVKEKWAPEIRSSCGKVPVILVGTQSDLREDAKTLVQLAQYKEHPVPEAEARKLASSLGCVTYVESSSLTQKNLKDVFDHAIMAGLKFRNKKELKKKKGKTRKKICTIL